MASYSVQVGLLARALLPQTVQYSVLLAVWGAYIILFRRFVRELHEFSDFGEITCLCAVGVRHCYLCCLCVSLSSCVCTWLFDKSRANLNGVRIVLS